MSINIFFKKLCPFHPLTQTKHHVMSNNQNCTLNGSSSWPKGTNVEYKYSYFQSGSEFRASDRGESILCLITNLDKKRK